MPDLPSIEYAKLAKILREELDVHSAFTWEKFLREGLDAHFNARLYSPITGTTYSVKASDYWFQSEYKSPFSGYVRLPAGNTAVSICSKRAFSYPVLSARVQLPDWTGVGEGVERNFYFGLENGGSGGNGIASFVFARDANNVESMDCFVGGDFFKNFTRLSVISLLPSNYKTAIHVYTVKVARQLALFSVDSTIVAIILFAPGFNYNTGFTPANPPYGIACVPTCVSQFQTSLIELYLTSVLSVDISAPLSPFGFRLSDGDPIQPLSLPLYIANTSTKFAGYSISSGSITSHPFPLLGYDNKTFVLQANQAGTFELQVLTRAGNWRTYYSDTVTANRLFRFIMDGQAVIGRVVFTPSAYPCTVSDAEVTLA